MPIPLIDFHLHDDPGLAIDQSLSQVGFMMLKNIGIDSELLKQVYAESKRFFLKPEAYKKEFEYRSAEENFGYQGIMQENLDPNAPADIKETFTMRNILQAPLDDTRWPSSEFKALMQSFFQNALDATHEIQKIMAKQLGVDEDFFVRSHTGDTISLRLLYYPPISQSEITEHQLGAGAHTDYGFLTLLFQDNVGGLQVLDKKNEWLDVEPVEGGIVINSGDLLEQWTNRKYKSTLHRVKPRLDGKERLSIAMFIDPDSDTLVNPLESCIDEANPCHYEPTTAGEHLHMKLTASHKDRFK